MLNVIHFFTNWTLTLIDFNLLGPPRQQIKSAATVIIDLNASPKIILLLIRFSRSNNHESKLRCKLLRIAFNDSIDSEAVDMP